jgi:predicted phage gp36 major capsid-like protein
MQEFQQADASKIMDDHSAEDAADVAMMNSNDLEKQQDKAKKEILELTTKLRAFQQSNERALEDLKGKHMKQLKGKEEESQKIIMVLFHTNGARKWSGDTTSRQKTWTRPQRPKFPRLLWFKNESLRWRAIFVVLS